MPSPGRHRRRRFWVDLDQSSEANKPESRVASARSFDGGLFEVASQRSTSGTWKRVTLVLTTAQLALRRRKAGISRAFSSIELRREERPYGSRPCGAECRAYSVIVFADRPSVWRDDVPSGRS